MYSPSYFCTILETLCQVACAVMLTLNMSRFSTMVVVAKKTKMAAQCIALFLGATECGVKWSAPFTHDAKAESLVLLCEHSHSQ